MKYTEEGTTSAFKSAHSRSPVFEIQRRPPLHQPRSKHLSRGPKSPASPGWFIALDRRPRHAARLLAMPRCIQSLHQVSSKVFISEGFPAVTSYASQTTKYHSSSPKKNPKGRKRSSLLSFRCLQ
ncbi:uncharacterized protein VSU04_014947 isoform 1-T2 [Chlamydotis macqueenii]